MLRDRACEFIYACDRMLMVCAWECVDCVYLRMLMMCVCVDVLCRLCLHVMLIMVRAQECVDCVCARM